ncbi:hypothetical protein Hanom_Chr04g00372711 [Helianthus anomalus]
MELHSAAKGIQLFKTLICGTSGLYYFHKKVRASKEGKWQGIEKKKKEEKVSTQSLPLPN